MENKVRHTMTPLCFLNDCIIVLTQGWNSKRQTNPGEKMIRAIYDSSFLLVVSPSEYDILYGKSKDIPKHP